MLPLSRATRTLLLVLLLIYGIAAGLRTVADFDLGWQMADARHPWSSVDSLSYTAAGRPWIYPPLAGVLFRALFQLGGYAAISWFCCAALLVTLATTAWRSSAGTLALLLLALPALAAQMIPRSGLFTVVIAALFSRLLFSEERGARARRSLWLLPPLMVLWVNLHTGFIAGLALIALYGAERLLEAPHRLSRMEAGVLITTAAATLVNPHGAGIYRVIAAQEHISTQQASTVVELAPLYWSFFPQDLLRPLSAEGAIWWLLVASTFASGAMLVRRQYARAVLTAGAIATCLFSARSQSVFIPLAALLAGPLISRVCGRWAWRGWTRLALPVAAVLVVFWSCFNLVSGRSAILEDQVTRFGAGASWWLPREAADFIQQEHLPTQLFSTFNLSSYLAWRLGPAYRDFADGRYLPFGDDLIALQLRLAATPLDAPEWTGAAKRYGIRTVIFPTSRFYGVASLPLQQDCQARGWEPVYFDPEAIVFLRLDTPEAARLPRLDCAKQKLVPVREPGGFLARTLTYEQLADAAVLYYLLGRNGEAVEALARATAIFSADDSMELLRGQLAATGGDLPGAESALRAALRLHPSDAAWYQLGIVLAREQQYADATHALREARRLARPPSYAVDYALARTELLAGDREAALGTADAAMALASGSSSSAAEARAALDDLHTTAYMEAGDVSAAILAEQEAIRETPDSQARWGTLAAIFEAAGRTAEAQDAQSRAMALRARTH